MAEPYVGMILPFPYTFAPLDWNFCQGQSLSIQQYEALYSLISVAFGGDGVKNFNLPEMRGRTVMGAGAGQSGLSSYKLAQKGGVEQVAMGLAQLPVHNHTATFTGTGGSAGTPLSVSVDVSLNTTNVSTPSPTNNYLGPVKMPGVNQPTMWSQTPTSSTPLGGVKVSGGGGGITGGTVAVANTGGSQPMSVLNPYLALNFCIALVGIYPQRP